MSADAGRPAATTDLASLGIGLLCSHRDVARSAEASLRKRYPAATVVQGDAYGVRALLGGLLQQPASAIVSGLPLFSKPMRMRVRLLRDALELMQPAAPFVQFTYAVVPPIPKRMAGVRTESSERIWKNVPPARVWVYRKG